MPLAENVKKAAIDAAKASGIDPAALLAVIEIESGGRLFEEDGKTPTFLFERHKFYSELAKHNPGKLREAIDAGLAHKDWRKATQYRDQGTSKNRLALIARARKIDVEDANRAASWGLGQTMGFNAEGLGFKNATEMVNYMTKGGIPAQVDAMVREIKRNKLERYLPPRVPNWPAFAKGYNGPGYAANRYDIKLQQAYDKWRNVLRVKAPQVAAKEPIDMPDRKIEVKPMRHSSIGNGAIVAGGTAAVGGSLVAADAVNKSVTTVAPAATAPAPTVTDAITKTGDVIGSINDTAWGRFISILTTMPSIVVGCLLLTIAVCACAYIWYRRYTLKQEMGV